MKKMRKITMAVLLVLTMGLLSACGKKFDASGYVKSVMDASYKGEFKEYCKLTNSKEDEAEKMYNGNIENAMKEFETVGISEELQAKYKDFFVSLMKQTKYSVAEAKEDGDNFTVELTIEPIMIFDGLQEELMTEVEAYQEEVQAAVQDGGAVPTQEEITEKVFEMLYNIIDARLADIKYGDAQTITVHVTKDKNNVYSINSADLTEIDSIICNLDGLQL